MRRVLVIAFATAIGMGSALADDAAAVQPASPRAPSPTRPKPQAKHGPTRSAKLPKPRPAAAADILGTGTATKAVAAAPAKVGSSWSIDPSWSASSGPTAAAYGTRGLLDELKRTPGESSGYGAGAALNLHF